MKNQDVHTHDFKELVTEVVRLHGPDGLVGKDILLQRQCVCKKRLTYDLRREIA